MNWAGARGLVSKLAKPEQQGTINYVLLVCWSSFIHSFISSRCSFFHHLLPRSHCSGPFRCLLASHLPPHSQTQHEAWDDFHIHGCSWVLPSTYCIVSITAHDECGVYFMRANYGNSYVNIYRGIHTVTAF